MTFNPIKTKMNPRTQENMMEFTFRQADLANLGDQQHLLRLLNDFAQAASIQQPLAEHVKATLISNLRQHPTTLVYFAEHTQTPIGLAVCFLGFSTFANQPLLNIHDFYVHTAFQGQGIGKAFLNFLEQQAKARGCCKVTLEVYAHNTGARAFYECQGYIGSRPDDPEHTMYALAKQV
jgi:GNAT superfamily N-acetyltransferase